MMMIETKRLTLERSTLKDAAFLLNLMNTPGWIRFIGDRGIHTVKDAEEYIQRLISSYKNPGYGLYVMRLKNTGIAIGLCGFVKRDYLDQPDIGFAILPEYEGQGYVFEAASSMIQYGTRTLLLNPIFAITTEGNDKSRRLLAKLGLKETGKIRPKDHAEELLLYSS